MAVTIGEFIAEQLKKSLSAEEAQEANEFITEITNVFTSIIPEDFSGLIKQIIEEAENQINIKLPKIEGIKENPSGGSSQPQFIAPTDEQFSDIIGNDITEPVTTEQLIEVAKKEVNNILVKETTASPSNTVIVGQGNLNITTQDNAQPIPKIIEQSGTSLLKGQSPQIIQIDAIMKRIQAHKILHVASQFAIVATSIVVEVYSLGQIDKIVENLLVLYNLIPSSTIYNAVQGQDLEASLLRVYRYLSESANRTVIPPPTDLITFLTREQLDPDTKKAREIFERFMGYHGFDSFWSNAYWGSHWILPSTGQLYEMLGRKIISPIELRRQLEINDLHPDWIPKLIELSRELPNRTEARMIQRTRKMEKVKLQRIMDNARIHEDYQEDYEFWLENQELDTLNLQWIKQIRDMFVKGYRTEEQFKEALAKSIYSEEEQKRVLEIDILKKEEKINDMRLQTLVLQNRKNTISDGQMMDSGGTFVSDRRLLEVKAELEQARKGLLVEIDLGTDLGSEEDV